MFHQRYAQEAARGVNRWPGEYDPYRPRHQPLVDPADPRRPSQPLKPLSAMNDTELERYRRWEAERLAALPD